jgi:hypothetical protein
MPTHLAIDNNTNNIPSVLTSDNGSLDSNTVETCSNTNSNVYDSNNNTATAPMNSNSATATTDE